MQVGLERCSKSVIITGNGRRSDDNRWSRVDVRRFIILTLISYRLERTPLTSWKISIGIFTAAVISKFSDKRVPVFFSQIDGMILFNIN